MLDEGRAPRAGVTGLRGNAAARRGDDAITYSALIAVCKQGKHPEQALQASEAMQQQGVVPNAITHNDSIGACEKWQASRRASQVSEAMQ